MTRRWVAVAVALLAVAACGGGSKPVAAPSTQPSPTISSEEVFGLFNIGHGQQVYAECYGSGSPTIVLEAGDGSDHGGWSQVRTGLEPKTRVCVYDRLGLGRSTAASGCRTLADLRSVLEAVLEKLHETGPFLLVGASGGGYLAAGYAEAHPDNVVGIVLVETPRAIIPANADKVLLQQLKCSDPSNLERRDFVRVENEAWSGKHKIGAIPITIISNDFGAAATNDEERNNVKDQRGWLVLGTNTKQVVVTSGHDVPNNEPDVVIKEIERVLSLARA